jgi:hypothetical protein
MNTDEHGWKTNHFLLFVFIRVKLSLLLPDLIRQSRKARQTLDARIKPTAVRFNGLASDASA